MAGGGAGSATPLQWPDFEKVDMRVGIVTDAREFPEARRPAYRLWIDVGPLGVRRSSAQLTTHYRPADLIGRLARSSPKSSCWAPTTPPATSSCFTPTRRSRRARRSAKLSPRSLAAAGA
jgi:hypothetical protein